MSLEINEPGGDEGRHPEQVGIGIEVVETAVEWPAGYFAPLGAAFRKGALLMPTESDPDALRRKLDAVAACVAQLRLQLAQEGSGELPLATLVRAIEWLQAVPDPVQSGVVEHIDVPPVERRPDTPASVPGAQEAATDFKRPPPPAQPGQGQARRPPPTAAMLACPVCHSPLTVELFDARESG